MRMVLFFFVFRDKPRIGSSSINLERLRTLPDGTLGREYVRFMDYYVSSTIIIIKYIFLLLLFKNANFTCIENACTMSLICLLLL